MGDSLYLVREIETPGPLPEEVVMSNHNGSLEFINRPVVDLGVRDHAEKQHSYPTRETWERYMGFVAAAKTRAEIENRCVLIRCQVDNTKQDC